MQESRHLAVGVLSENILELGVLEVMGALYNISIVHFDQSDLLQLLYWIQISKLKTIFCSKLYLSFIQALDPEQSGLLNIVCLQEDFF